MKRCRFALLAATLMLAQPHAARSQEATLLEWLSNNADAMTGALEEIDFYLKISSVPGVVAVPVDGDTGPCTFKTCQAYQVEEVNDYAGGTVRVARPLSPEELGALARFADASMLASMGSGLMTAQVTLNENFFGGNTDRDAFRDILESDLEELGDDQALPLVLNPQMILAAGGIMAEDAAAAIMAGEASLSNSAALAQAAAVQAAQAYRQAEFTGTRDVGGVPTFVYATPNFDLPPQFSGNTQWDFDAGEFLVDPENKRFLKQRLEGTATTENESRDFFLEVEYSDFRNPPGCGQMDEPFRRVMRMGGILDDEQMAEMEQARAQIAEFEAQLAAMPAQQREMMERMMGSQMEMMRNLLNNGAFEYIEETEQVLCNPDFESLFRIGGGSEDDEDLVRQIQEYLVILGYEPGNVDGVLDDLTRVAISQFQAEQGLPVTGEPSAELAARLLELVTG